MTLEFHPLADLFPLIEGAEFDELVGSIKENGLRESIITFDGKILDGRNRYRACLAADVFPRLEIFDGTDPVRFVIDKNIHRRNLSASQRAVIASKLATLKIGQHARVGSAEPTAISQTQAGVMMDVARHTIGRARVLLDHGTPQEIAAVESGRRGLRKLTDEIKARLPPEAEKPKPKQDKRQSGKNPERIQRQQINAEIWGRVRDALVHLTSLPRPLEVMPIARACDRTGLVDARVLQALQWLEEFADGWTGNETENRKARASS